VVHILEQLFNCRIVNLVYWLKYRYSDVQQQDSLLALRSRTGPLLAHTIQSK
jgi:hypothetical protein